MTDKESVIEGLEHCKKSYCYRCPYVCDGLCGANCTAELASDVLDLLKEQEGYVSVPFSWLVKFCTHIDFKEPVTDADRELLWKQKLKQQFGIDLEGES